MCGHAHSSELPPSTLGFIKSLLKKQSGLRYPRLGSAPKAQYPQPARNGSKLLAQLTRFSETCTAPPRGRAQAIAPWQATDGLWKSLFLPPLCFLILQLIFQLLFPFSFTLRRSDAKRVEGPPSEARTRTEAVPSHTLSPHCLSQGRNPRHKWGRGLCPDARRLTRISNLEITQEPAAQIAPAKGVFQVCRPKGPGARLRRVYRLLIPREGGGGGGGAWS